MKSLTLAVLLFGALTLSSFSITPKGDHPLSSDETNIVHFRIELCSFKKMVPVKTVEKLREIGGVIPVKSNGKSVYYTAPYSSEQEAEKAIASFKEMGFSDAKQVVQYNGRFITVKEYHKINSSGPGVRIWK
jgi:uncharacterized protein YegP (UPF0339 family)